METHVVLLFMMWPFRWRDEMKTCFSLTSPQHMAQWDGKSVGCGVPDLPQPCRHCSLLQEHSPHNFACTISRWVFLPILYLNFFSSFLNFVLLGVAQFCGLWVTQKVLFGILSEVQVCSCAGFKDRAKLGGANTIPRNSFCMFQS